MEKFQKDFMEECLKKPSKERLNESKKEFMRNIHDMMIGEICEDMYWIYLTIDEEDFSKPIFGEMLYLCFK